MIGKDPPDGLKGWNSHGKKKGGEKVDGFERRWAWKISGSRSQVARASARAKTDRMAGKTKKRDRDRVLCTKPKKGGTG